MAMYKGDDPKALKKMKAIFGPGQVDHLVRNAIQTCWIGLAENRKTVDELEKQFRRIVAASGEITANDVVIEVGPGTGTLTEELLAAGAQIVAVEIDRALAALLRRKFADAPSFSLIEGDALAGKHSLNENLAAAIAEAKRAGKSVKLVANLPYNIASPLIVELLMAGVDLLAFTVQKEVADRLRAVPGGKEYGTLSIVVQMLAEVEMLRTLPPQAFWPRPKISSALVRLRRQDRLGKTAGDFARFVQKIFSARRKTLRNALGFAGDADQLLTDSGLNAQLRPEDIAPTDFVRLFRASAD
jgi:16S rRNA (adenine1518-N6/adenine1519-N6)-dimethyltransferase